MSHSKRLRQHQAKLAKAAAEAQQAFLAAEDGLNALEDRESRRAARTATADAEMRQKYGALT